jgi:hypothetical protein
MKVHYFVIIGYQLLSLLLSSLSTVAHGQQLIEIVSGLAGKRKKQRSIIRRFPPADNRCSLHAETLHDSLQAAPSWSRCFTGEQARPISLVAFPCLGLSLVPQHGTAWSSRPRHRCLHSHKTTRSVVLPSIRMITMTDATILQS